jgi:DNA repair protein RadC
MAPERSGVFFWLINSLFLLPLTYYLLTYIYFMEELVQTLGIKSWAEEDRPREKLLTRGRHVLSDAELIAILIGSGSRNETAVELSRRILNQYQNNLNELAKLGVKDLMKFRGIGEAKAISIIAALELGRRRKDTELQKRTRITMSKDVFDLMSREMLDLPHEEFWVLLLNRANVVIRKERVSAGGVSGTVVDPKIIFKNALEHLACAIILCHNHPSGNLKPSDADLNLTRQLKQAGALLEIPVLDHIIVSNEGYYSFADEGLM